MEDEEVIRIYVQAFLRYGGRKFTTSFKNFVIPTKLNGYVGGCPIIGSQTQDNSYKEIW